jgi:tRNA 2-selenouridine synthase
LKPDVPVLVEAESSRIGRLNLPSQLFKAMQAAPRIEITATIAERASYLARTYAGAVADADGFCVKLDRLIGLRGRAQVESWQAGVRAGDFPNVAASLIKAHYDPAYANVRASALDRIVVSIDAARLDAEGLDSLAQRVARAVKPALEAGRPALA